MFKIFLADDEKHIRDLLSSFLKKAGYEVLTFETGDQLFLKCLDECPDLVVLDVNMPGTSGLEISKRLKEKFDVPVLLLTARDSDEDYEQGFEYGINDYFIKPFSPTKLVLRIKLLLKKTKYQNVTADILTLENLSLELTSRILTYQGNSIKLTKNESLVLRKILEMPNKSVSRDVLLNEVWGYDSDVETRVTDDTIKRLRKKMLAIDSHLKIETVWGFGFRLVNGVDDV